MRPVFSAWASTRASSRCALLAALPLVVACQGQVEVFGPAGDGGNASGGAASTGTAPTGTGGAGSVGTGSGSASTGSQGTGSAGTASTGSQGTGSGSGGASPAGSSGASVVTVGTSSSSGFPTTGSSGTGGGPCSTCSDALNGFPGQLCPSSQVLFDSLIQCGCQLGCPMECANSCVGQSGDVDCFGCLTVQCQTQLDACLQD